jgi:arsenite oxidase small subunit
MTGTNDRDKQSRRQFLEVTAGAGVTTILAGCNTGYDGDETEPEPPGTDTPPETPAGTVERLEAYPRVRVASVAEIEEGDVETFNYPLQGQENFITKIGTEAWGGVGPDDDIVAFNSLCTHAGCSMTGQVTPSDQMAGPCPCHFTSFDIAKGGLVVLGQASADLPQVSLEVEDGDVYATGVDGLVWGYHDNLRTGDPVTAGD